ncbi:hypothetical protein HanPSC8_Chr15g0691701 [Helianthus annuus]|nr:hypothetical protein HanPSC8_Chr15g0691701 [Helianthus annuus]
MRLLQPFLLLSNLPGSFKQDLFSGNHGEPRTNVLMNRITKLGPTAPLEGPLAKPGLSELPDTCGGGDLDLVTIIIEFVLDHLLDPIAIGPDHLPRRE